MILQIWYYRIATTLNSLLMLCTRLRFVKLVDDINSSRTIKHLHFYLYPMYLFNS
jgi:hypothetical protein